MFSRSLQATRTSRTARYVTSASTFLLLSGGLFVPTASAQAVTQAATTTQPEIKPVTQPAALTLTPLGTYETGVFDESAAEIVAFHAATQRAFVINAKLAQVDVLDASDPTNPQLIGVIKGAGIANSIAIRPDGLGVIALESETKTDPGAVAFFDATSGDFEIIGQVSVGSLPDMVTISADGHYAVVANEGEPSGDFGIDPEGSISIITLPTTLTSATQSDVKTATFHDYEATGTKTLPADVLIFGPTPHGDDNPVSRNLEPEYVTITGDQAYVTLQENNAIAVVDLPTAQVTDILPLGFKDYSLPGNALDASDRDGQINIKNYPGLFGIYQPDGIASYTAAGQTYLVTANEGDAREWGNYAQAARVKSLAKDGYGPICADSSLANQTKDEDLGRLQVSIEHGLKSEPGTGPNTDANCYDALYTLGGRSFSIWNTQGEQVFDSGDDFEQITAAQNPEFFNSNHTESNFEGRSDDKGPEPEGLTVGQVGAKTYAFIGLERVGGVMVYDITTPDDATFVTYLNNRDFSESVADGGNLSEAGDLGPEGLAFVPATDSPTGTPMLIVGNEVSGTTTFFDITAPEPEPEPGVVDFSVLAINDFHGRLVSEGASAGAAVLAGAVSQKRAENPNTIFVSAGDNIGASTFVSFSAQDNPTIDALKATGLDVSAVGNHEFDAGFADLRDRVIPRFGGAEYALGANVYFKGTKNPALASYALKEVDGITVGFIGTVTQQTATLVSPSGIAEIEFGDQLEAANRVAGELSDGDPSNGEADVIVLLTHEGSATNDCVSIATEDTEYGQLIRQADPAIEAIVSGHTHQKYACDIAVPGTESGPEGKQATRPVIQSDQYGTTLGQLNFQVDAVSKDVLAVSSELNSLTYVDENQQTQPAYLADATVAGLVAQAQLDAGIVGQKVIGSIAGDINRGGVNGSDRGVESELGNLVADIQLWATSSGNPAYAGKPAQIALMNPGGLRADLAYGENGQVTYQDVANVQPFGNTLWTVDLTGAVLRQVLEEQWQPAGSSRPKLHLGVSAGFTYEFDATKVAGARIGKMFYQGELITPEQVFTVTTNSFLVAGGDNFTSFTKGKNATDTGLNDLIVAINYFETHANVSPAPLGRAVLAEISDNQAPDAPAKVQVSNLTSSSARLRWNQSNDNVALSAYVITYTHVANANGTPAKGGTKQIAVNAGRLAHSLTDLQPGATYRVHLRARDVAGNTSTPISFALRTARAPHYQ